MARKPPPLPSLDFFKGFEAAARHLSFTRAAEELFVTQSAVSRQIQALESRLGVALFQRRNRGLALTDEGEQMWRAVDGALRTLHQAVEQVSPGAMPKMVTVTSSMAFSSLWLIPRLSGFRRRHPEVDVRISANNQVLDLDRERIDLAIRYCPPRSAPSGSVRLFGEEILPVCSPALLRDRKRPLKSPQDLRHHVLLHFDEPHRPTPWLTWNVWLESVGVPDLEPADSLRFNHYDQTIGAALGGQGVALGRRPLVRKLLADGALVAPFPLGSVTDRAYFIVRTALTSGRPEVNHFVEWLIAEAAATTAREGDGGVSKRKSRRQKKWVEIYGDGPIYQRDPVSTAACEKGEEMENPVTQMNDSSRWARLLYMILFAVLYKVAEFIMWVVVLFQVIVTLITGGPNERALRFGKQLSVYVYGLWAYLTYNTEKKPFPFSDWPTTTSPPSTPQGGTEKSAQDGETGT